MSAITQPRMNGREVVRCECGLVQFRSSNERCVKTPCGKPYGCPKCKRMEHPQHEPNGLCWECWTDDPANVVFVDNPNFPLKDGKISQYDGRIRAFSDPDVPQDVRNGLAVKAIPMILRILRHSQGHSQKTLSQVLGCPRTYISKLENTTKLTTPNYKSLERLCYTFGISMEGFLYLCEQAA